MSLMSQKEKLESKAESGVEIDVLRAALLESQDRYNENASRIAMLLEKYDQRISAVEAAVRASNEKKRVNVLDAMREASKAILLELGASVVQYKTEVDDACKRLKKADQKNDIKTGIQLFAFFVISFFIAGYLALWVYGRWYGLASIIDKLDVINNACWQLLHMPK